MKISLNDFLLSHKKTAGFEFVEKIFQSNQFTEKPSAGKTFCLTSTGAEVHSGKPLVSHLKPVETLKEKIARFEKLEKNLNLIRMRAYVSGALQFEDDADDFDDFEFANDNTSDVDSFGDPFDSPADGDPFDSPADVESDVDKDAGVGPAPQQPGAEPKRPAEASDEKSDVESVQDS